MTEDERVRSKLQKIAHYVQDQFPKGWGFVVLAFPFGAGGRMNYVANAQREDVVRAMYEFISATKQSWASHQDDSKEHDAELGVQRQRVAELEELVRELKTYVQQNGFGHNQGLTWSLKPRSC